VFRKSEMSPAAKVALEAKNLAPEIADLSGGNPLRTSSSGGSENLAKFEVVGRKTGSFLMSIRLVPSAGRPLLANPPQ